MTDGPIIQDKTAKTPGNRVTIEPITRLEGHGKIEMFLDEKGNVAKTYLQIPELRGFEEFCKGRPAEEMPRITQRICGVCPMAHHFGSMKALDACFSAKVTPAGRKLRELMYNGYYIYDHTLHFYALAAPDFVVGPAAPAAQRNILGVIDKVGMEIAGEVIKHRAYGQKIIELIGGRATHPVCGLPGGMSKPITDEQRLEILKMAESSIEFAKFTLKLFEDVVLGNKAYLDLVTSDAYRLETSYMGLVNDKNQVDFYDGKVRVVDPEGKESAKFAAADYLGHIEEHVEPWSYVKQPYLKKVGWQGFTEGAKGGLYRVGPLARLNAADSMATPLANKEYYKMYETLGGKPAHHTLAYHWARLIELLQAAEKTVELARDPEVASPDVRGEVGPPGEGVGVVEAARGTLFHHYTLNEKGLVEKVNLIVPTTHNAPSINMSVGKAAKGLIKNWQVSPGLLNMVEMAFRAYDPCFSCATHYLGGRHALEVKLRKPDGTLYQTLRNFGGDGNGR